MREAFRLLTQEGLLRHEPNCEVLVSLPDMTAIIDIYRIHRMIEYDALQHAYPLHPAIARMNTAVQLAKSYRIFGNWQKVETGNMAFHATVVKLSQ